MSSATATIDETRFDLEEELAGVLAVLLAHHAGVAIAALGEPPRIEQLPLGFWSDLTGELVSDLPPILERVYFSATRELSDRYGLAVTDAELSRRARQWSASRVHRLAADIVRNTDETLRRHLAAHEEQDRPLLAALALGVTAVGLVRVARGNGEVDLLTPAEVRAERESIYGELTERIERQFSTDRAESIAITETTEAITGGERDATRMYEELFDTSVLAIWQTRRDERVCPTCAPLDGTPEEVWSQVAYDGPPAHPRCRCGLRHFVDGREI